MDDYGWARRSHEERAAQREIKKNGLKDDDAGHHSAHRFFRNGGLAHLFPQNSNFNRSAWRRMENEWADWIAHGMEVNYKIDFGPDHAVRPDRITVSYEIRNLNTGATIFRRRDKQFQNSADQSSDRTGWLDMRSYI